MANQNTIADLSTTPASNLNVLGQSQQGTAPGNTIDSIFQKYGALIARAYADMGGTGTVGGTANAITLTTASTYQALTNGMLVAFKATADNSAATTINVDALGAKAIRAQGDTALAGGEIKNKGTYLLRYDTAYNSAAGAWVLINAGGGSAQAYSSFYNLGLTASVGSSALTIAVKGVDGNDPSASNPVIIPLRNVTAATGTPTFLTLTAALSLVISSGSTLGMTSAVAATLAIVLFNDAGTPRLGLINPLQLPLADGIASSTAEGGAGAADSAGVFYTGTAVTSKAYTVIGYATATEATAGTWATAPATLKVTTDAGLGNVLPIVTSWVSYTPTFTAFGTVTGINFWSRRVGGNLEVRGYATPGTTIASQGRVSIGFNGTDGNVTISTSLLGSSTNLVGSAGGSAAASYQVSVLALPTTSYLTLSASSLAGGAMTSVNGNDALTSRFGMYASVPIQGW